MDLSATLLVSILTIPFAFLLIYIGLDMIRIKSISKELAKYEKSKNYETPVRKYFYWWSLKSQRSITKSSINFFGDIFVSRFYQLAGWFFIVGGALAITSTVILILLNI